MNDHPATTWRTPPTLWRALLLTGALSLVLRAWISVALPITGDEAYFYWWGVLPDWGYYDHPPMAGWWIAALLGTFGHALWAIRLPAVLLPLVLGGVLWWAFAPLNRERAAWAVLLFWLAPLNWLNALITTDTPLMFWSLLSMACLVRAESQASAKGLYAASGLFLGLAFLSKYFAVVLGLTYLVYFAVFRRERWLSLALLVLCALPGPVINLVWNMGHGWANIMFNVYNRNQASSFDLYKPGMYLLMLAYLLTPAVLWLGWKHRSALRGAMREQRLLACLLLVPLLFFALLSLKKVVGLHWVLSFYPMAFLLLAFALPKPSLKHVALGIGVFSLLHVAAVLGVASTSLDQWRGKSHYPSLVRAFRMAEILKQFEAPGVVLMADAYSPASVYGYVGQRYVPVFGPGSFHARQDDFLTDFSVYQGKTIRVLLSDPAVLSEFTPYFESVQPLQISQNGAEFHAIEGRNFNYAAYRDGVLRLINERYYNIPRWLPMSDCPFCRHYCGEIRCTP